MFQCWSTNVSKGRVTLIPRHRCTEVLYLHSGIQVVSLVCKSVIPGFSAEEIPTRSIICGATFQATRYFFRGIFIETQIDSIEGLV